MASLAGSGSKAGGHPEGGGGTSLAAAIETAALDLVFAKPAGWLRRRFGLFFRPSSMRSMTSCRGREATLLVLPPLAAVLIDPILSSYSAKLRHSEGPTMANTTNDPKQFILEKTRTGATMPELVRDARSSLGLTEETTRATAQTMLEHGELKLDRQMRLLVTQPAPQPAAE